MTQPPLPKNVRILTPAGTTIPLELIYLGQDPAGIHQWKAVTDISHLESGARLLADELPGHTDISIGFRR